MYNYIFIGRTLVLTFEELRELNVQHFDKIFYFIQMCYYYY